MIAIGCDHGGYELKQKILAHLRQRGLEYRDFGCDSTASVDYPVYGKAVAHAVASGECEKGIVICSTGIGISIGLTRLFSQLLASGLIAPKTGSIARVLLLPMDGSTVPFAVSAATKFRNAGM